MKIDDIIRELKELMEKVASMECPTPDLAKWQAGFLDIIGINIEILKVKKEIMEVENG